MVSSYPTSTSLTSLTSSQFCHNHHQGKKITLINTTNSNSNTLINTMAAPSAPTLPLPDALSTEQCHALNAGRSLTFEFNNTFLIQIHPLPISTTSTTNNNDNDILLPTSFGPNRHVRIWSREGSHHHHQSDSIPLESTCKVELAYEETFHVCGAVTVLQVHHDPDDNDDNDADDDAWDTLLKEPMFLVDRNHDDDDDGSGSSYSLIRFITTASEDKPADAEMLGPVMLPLPQLFHQLTTQVTAAGTASASASASASALHLQVSVAFSAPPLPRSIQAVQPLMGNFRGFVNMPPRALRIAILHATAAAANNDNDNDDATTMTMTMTPASWVQLLQPLSKQVKHHLRGSRSWAIELMCREVYEPVSGQSLHRMPMVVITAMAESVQEAQRCMAQVQHILCMHRYTNVQVQMRLGGIARAAAHRLAVHANHELPHIGASIGRPSSTSFATLGGWLCLEKKKTDNDDDNKTPTRYLCAMTNHHAVVDGPHHIAFPSTNPDLAVDCPAASMINTALQQAEVSARAAEETISRLQYSGTGLAKRDIATDVLGSCNNYLLLLQARKANIHLGHTIASSGLVEVPTHGRHLDPTTSVPHPLVSEMDWALVKVDYDPQPGSITYNKVIPSLTDDFEFTNQCLKKGLLDFGSMDLYLQEGHRNVAKVNKYSKVSYGTLNPFRACILFEDKKHETLVYAVPFDSLDDGGAFGGPGDSGAWVFGTEGTVIGLYVGNSSPEANWHTSYLIDIDEVNQDIEKQTGYTITIAK